MQEKRKKKQKVLLYICEHEQKFEGLALKSFGEGNC